MGLLSTFVVDGKVCCVSLIGLKPSRLPMLCHRKSQLNCMQRLCDWVKRRSISVSYICIYI